MPGAIVPRGARCGAAVAFTDLLGRPVHSGSVLFGVALVGAVGKPASACPADLVFIDTDGVIWLLDQGTRSALVRRSLASALRVYASLGELVRSVERGYCALVPAREAPFVGLPWRSS